MTIPQIRPAPRPEFLRADIPGGFVNLRCKGCKDVTRFVRGDELAMRKHKAGHVCTPVRPADEGGDAA